MNSIHDAQVIKKVQSVLEKNVDVRNRMLMMNKGKYSQYDGIFVPSIGEYYQIHGFKGVTDVTGGRSLTEYTYDDKGEYGSKIISDNSLGNIKQYSVTNDKIFRRNRYNNFENGDYLSYVDSVYGQNDAAVNFIESFLQGVSPEYAMRATEVGVVRDLRINSALNGIVTTNPNYRKGDNIVNLIDAISSNPFDFDTIKNIAINDTDTRIGIIANAMYSNSLYYAATVNTERGRNRASEHPYLTPYLFGEYGNNLSTINKLSDILWVDQKYGRTRNELGNGIGVMEFSDVHPQNNGAWKEIADQFSNEGVIYAPLNGLGYANVINGKVENEKFDGSDIRVNIREYVGTIDKRKPLHFVHDELDNVGARSYQTIKTDDNGEPLYDEDFEEESPSTIDLIQEEFDTYFPLYDGMVGDNNLLAKTKKMFDSHKINTMMARFHTAENGEPSNDSAYDRTYGNSHGRSLKILDADKRHNRTNGYSNPYCRTWTYHHEYDRYSRAIRPFVYVDDDGRNRSFDINEIQNSVSEFRSKNDNNNIERGGEYLAKYTVLQNNGFVRIAPTIQDYDIQSSNNDKNRMYNYMLSIENLAWKDFPGAIEENRKGPNGGRIMWFPPYDINFQENVGVEWNENAFIGRGEKVYTYANTTREATLGFTILIDHPSIVDKLRNYEGAGSDKDPDSDILRFFAGCHPFDFSEKDNEDVPSEQSPENTEEPEPAVNNEGGVIKFAVFFPNNYSGNGTVITKDEWRQIGYSDADWWEYLLCGHNVTVDLKNPEDWIGYEMKDDDRGISDTEPIPIVDEKKFIYACANKADANFKECGKDNADNRRRFRYRVDFDLRQHLLHYDKDDIENDSYVDSKSYGYNTYISAVQFEDSYPQSTTHTFGEVFAVLDYFLNNRNLIYDRVLSLGARGEELNKLKDIFSKKTISKIVVKGGATQQDSANSKALAERRAKTVGTTLYNIIKEINNEKVEVAYDDNFVFDSGDENLKHDLNVNGSKAKYQRRVQVEIYYSEQSIETNGNDITGATSNASETMDEDRAKIAYRRAEEQRIIESNKLEGYEYDYFNRLEVNDPFVFKRIKDKFKYFDPAFHSMSPEGFNARLNFLHQCTRQGHTLSASEVSGSTGSTTPTAGNLAFGRMPVCVLKIGDFINSRMIIRSMSIVYSNDGMQWDLNPEGIGVQPIFAKVTLGIVLLGGSALNMPVNRLQNAQTFDYYANTGVYDSNADRVEIDKDKGTIDYKLLYNP